MANIYNDTAKVRKHNEPDFIQDFMRASVISVSLEWAKIESPGISLSRLLTLRKQEVWDMAKLMYIRYRMRMIATNKFQMVIY